MALNLINYDRKFGVDGGRFIMYVSFRNTISIIEFKR